MTAIPAAMSLARLLENIPFTPIAGAVDKSYAKTPWDFGGGNREGRREIARRRLMPSFRQTFRNGTTRRTGNDEGPAGWPGLRGEVAAMKAAAGWRSSWAGRGGRRHARPPLHWTTRSVPR